MYIDFTIRSEEYNFEKLKQSFPNAKVLIKGDLLKSGKKISYNEFNFIFEKDDCFYVDDLIHSFKVFIKDKVLFLSDFIKSNKLESSICIVIKGGVENVGISLSNENLLFLCDINSSIDFDFI